VSKGIIHCWCSENKPLLTRRRRSLELQQIFARYWSALEQAYPTCAEWQKIVSKATRLWPDQYQRIWNVLHTIQQPIQELFTLLTDGKDSPKGIANRYLFLMSVQNTLTQIRTLLADCRRGKADTFAPERAPAASTCVHAIDVCCLQQDLSGTPNPGSDESPGITRRWV
jgi:hypothetical protein